MDVFTFLKTMLFFLDSKLTLLRLCHFASSAKLPGQSFGSHSVFIQKGTLPISYGLRLMQRSCSNKCNYNERKR